MGGQTNVEGKRESIKDKQPPSRPSHIPALPLGEAGRNSVIVLFRRAAVDVFQSKNQEARILVSGFLSITLGMSPPTWEPNVPIF